MVVASSKDGSPITADDLVSNLSLLIIIFTLFLLSFWKHRGCNLEFCGRAKKEKNRKGKRELPSKPAFKTSFSCYLQFLYLQEFYFLVCYH